ncbi:MAG: NYN domain-containing protein [Dehalococcoidia bacterium]|nr:NYN domain-containing protein [Dehalococcoidia bacterium]
MKLFDEFNQAHYLPRAANWTQLFDWIVEKAVKDGERLRTYWYVIETLDFFPYHLPDITASRVSGKDKQNLRKILSKHADYKSQLDKLDGEDLDERMIEIVKQLKTLEENKKRRFHGWIEIQEGIGSRHKAIEFRRAGAIKCNLFTDQLGREKAVDVKLASDMITLKDIYDIAIIVSGDQDYVPAVKVLKDYGKRIVNVSFRTRGGQLLPGGARRLKQVTDWSFDIPYVSLAKHLNIGKFVTK